MMAEIEADDIRDRTRGGVYIKVEEHKQWVGLNKPPYGYDKVGSKKTAQLVVNEEQARIVRLIFEWYVYGIAEVGLLSTVQIADKLTGMGIPTPMDELPEELQNKKRPPGHWTRDTILRTLNNRSYTGVFIHFQLKREDGKTVANPNKDEWREVPIPAIIDEALYKAAKDRLSKERTYSVRGTKYEYLVSRRIRCECGYKLQASTKEMTYTRKKTGETITYYGQYYRCMGAIRNKVAGSCDSKPLTVGSVDARVWEYIRTEIANPEILERKLREIQSEQYAGQEGKRETLDALYRNREAIEGELTNYAQLYAKRAMPEHILDKLMGEENHKLALTNAEIARVEKEVETPLSDDAILDLVAFSADFEAKLDAVGSTFQGRRTVVDGLDVQVTVIRQDGEVVLKITSIINPVGILLTLFPSPKCWRCPT
jgi:site-specific DNA recombinase